MLLLGGGPCKDGSNFKTSAAARSPVIEGERGRGCFRKPQSEMQTLRLRSGQLAFGRHSVFPTASC